MVSRKVLGIMGGPCLDGNTSRLLNAALEGAREAGAEVERLDLARMNVHPCLACRACDTGSSCSQEDDDMVQIYKRITSVDAIILASPIFFMGVTAQTKAMIDRCQCFWVEKYVLGRRRYEGGMRPKGLFVACAGSEKGIVFDPARHVAKAFFAAIDYEWCGEVLLPRTDGQGLESRRLEALAAARDAGRKLVDG